MMAPNALERPNPAVQRNTMLLPPPATTGGLPLMQALAQRRSVREFAARPLPLQALSNLLWAAAGINRKALGGRTVPSAMNSREIDLVVLLPAGAFGYDPVTHTLQLRVEGDLRRDTGYENFVDDAALEFVFVADLARMSGVAPAQREAYAAACAGAMAQNVYLYCASAGLAAALRSWIDPGILSATLRLRPGQHVVLTQGVGFPAHSEARGAPAAT